MPDVRSPVEGESWLALAAEELSVDRAYRWALRPDCGAVVMFSGTVRDHAEGRSGVESLTYEAYAEQAESSFDGVAGEVRRRWPSIGRIVIWHRVGELAVGESSVVVVVSAPHRADAFAAGRYAIDAVKATAPIWKKEHWADGDDWGTGATPVTAATDVPSTGDGFEVSAVPSTNDSVEGGTRR